MLFVGMRLICLGIGDMRGGGDEVVNKWRI